MALDIFQQQPVLENERVLLRPIQENDFDNLFLSHCMNRKYGNTDLVTAAGKENLRNYIDNGCKKPAG